MKNKIYLILIAIIISIGVYFYFKNITRPFISVGDKLGGMIVVNISPFNTGQYTNDPSLMKLTTNNINVNLKGIITITGMYYYLKTDEGFSGYCMSDFNEDSYSKIPSLPTDNVKKTFCFRNENFVEKELGANKEPKNVVVKIDNFEINRYPAEVVDRADLIEVIFK